MPARRDEILDCALKLGETDRLLIAERLLETVPDELSGVSVDDPEFLEEVERRFQDTTAAIPVCELWKQD